MAAWPRNRWGSILGNFGEDDDLSARLVAA
jgi:hypothetical protein